MPLRVYFVKCFVYLIFFLFYDEAMKEYTSQRKILDQLKKEGPQMAVTLSQSLGMTSMGARQHLEKLMKEGVVETFDVASGVGRPKRLWKLTKKADQYFPDRHDQLTASMLISIRNVFGKRGVDKLIADRTQRVETQYLQCLAGVAGLEDKVKALVGIRSEEGYVADYYPDGDGFIFVENHCPICAAATVCQGFCRSELEVFKRLFSALATVERIEYLLQGARRCAYSIQPVD